MKKILFIASGDPFEVGTAGQSVMKSFLIGMEQAGYLVSYLGFSQDPKINRTEGRIKLYFTRFNLRKNTTYSLLLKNLTGIEPWDFDTKQLENFTKQKGFDQVFVWEPTQVFIFRRMFLETPKSVLFSDPVAERISMSLDPQFLRYRLLIWLSKYVEPLYIKWISRFYTGFFIFGAGHAQVYSQRLKKTVKCLRPLLISTTNHIKLVKNNLIITYGGTYESTATRSSISDIKKLSYDLLNTGLKTKLQIIGYGWDEYDDPNVNVIGTVPDFEAALTTSSDVFIFPSNYNVGVRTRLAGALIAGNLVICHEDQTYNMPELHEFPGVYFTTNHTVQDILVHLTKMDVRHINELKHQNRRLAQKLYSYTLSANYFRD